MICAQEAKRRSIINAKGKQYLNNLESHILKAVDAGLQEAGMHIDITEGSQGSELMDAITTQLEKLGYKVDAKYAKPLPAGCPSSQWDFNNGWIKVSW